MLKAITWSSYFEVIGTLTILYYVAVVTLFYKSSVKNVLTRLGSNKRPTESQAPAPAEDPKGPTVADEKTDNLKLAAQVSEKLTAVIQKTIQDGVERPDMVASIRNHLQQYSHLRGTPYEKAISSAIQRELKNHSQSFSDGELQAVWQEK